MVHYLSLAVLILSCVSTGVLALKTCYQCNSYNDKDHTACIDPMSPYPAVNYTTCADSYVCTRVSYITQKQLVVSRSCDLSGDTCNNIYKTLYSYYPDMSVFNCYSCTGNYCNDASGFSYSGEITTTELEKPVLP